MPVNKCSIFFLHACGRMMEVFHDALADLKTVEKRWRLDVMAIRGEN